MLSLDVFCGLYIYEYIINVYEWYVWLDSVMWNQDETMDFSMEEKDPNDASQVSVQLINKIDMCWGVNPLPATVITRTITFLVGDSYKPSHHCYWEGEHPKNVFSMGFLYSPYQLVNFASSQGIFCRYFAAVFFRRACGRSSHCRTWWEGRGRGKSSQVK